MALTCELRDKWAEELRSGKYEQGEQHLQKDGKYCCLGVLCEIVGVKKKTISSDRVAYLLRSGPEPEYAYLDIEFPYEIAGLGPEDCRRFASLNDEGTSFDTIALLVDELDCVQPEEK